MLVAASAGMSSGPSSKESSTHALERRILSSMNQVTVTGGNGGVVEVSISFGTAFDDEGLGPLEVLRKADMAMFGAKEQGGNRCQLHAPNAAVPPLGDGN